MRFLATLALAALLLVPLPPVLAVDPLGDDAGSGGDAGDLPHDPLPVPPGSHAGRLRPLLGDARDAYAIDVPGMSILHLRAEIHHKDGWFVTVVVYDPELGLHTLADGGAEETVILPHAGRYVVYLMGEALPVADLPYTLHLALETPEGAFSVESGTAWQTVEVAWTEPGHVLARLERATAQLTGGSARSILYLEADLIFPSGSRVVIGFGMVTYEGDTGTRVIVRPLAPLPLPVEELPIRLERPAATGPWTLVTDHSAGLTGKLRIVSLGTEALRPVEIHVAADVPLETRGAEGDDLVTWSTSDAEGPAIVAPGVAVVGPRDLDLDVDGLFYGHFWTGAEEGSYTGPDGVEHVLPRHEDAFLGEAAQGPWRFHLGGGDHVGASAERMHLVGAFVPRLGLYTFVHPQ